MTTSSTAVIGRPRRRRAARRVGRAAGSAVVAVACLITPAAAAQDRSSRQAPLLNPNNGSGAWAGYSVEGGQRGRDVPHVPTPSVRGMDVSGHQGTVNWRGAWRSGARFSFIKATEGTTFRSSTYKAQYTGAHRVGMIRGAYHFALPNVSGAAAQARFFVNNGGDWKPDGRTLPGVLDIEYNPYGPTCYGLGPKAMSRWIAEFSRTYRSLTGRNPVIYTTRNWWNTCTGGNTSFADTNPLWVARYGPEVGALPSGWHYQTFWQHDNKGVFPGDQNLFNGSLGQLERFAAGTPAQRAAANKKR